MSVNKLCSKLIIGTANFNQKYGIANNFKSISKKEIKKIIKLAYLNKIYTFDTSPDYGNAEKNLGKYSSKNFNFISKLNKISTKNLNQSIESSIIESLKKLKKKKLEGLLLHDEKVLLKKRGLNIFNVLKKLKKKGLFKMIGVSFYNKNILLKTIKKFNLDFVQIPVNIFDQRFIDKDLINKLKEKKIKIYARSIFLQGILLKTNTKTKKKILKWDIEFKKYHNFLKENNLTPLEACLNFVLDKKFIDKILIGILNKKELLQILNCTNVTGIDYKIMKQNKKIKLINPSYW